jgi:hypothetical protein
MTISFASITIVKQRDWRSSLTYPTQCKLHMANALHVIHTEYCVTCMHNVAVTAGDEEIMINIQLLDASRLSQHFHCD